MIRKVELLVFDAAKDDGGGAWVDCPRRNVKMPVLICETCPHCAHVSRTDDDIALGVVCMAMG